MPSHNPPPGPRAQGKPADGDFVGSDKLFAPPPAEDATTPGTDEFDAAQMSGSWFTPEKSSNLGGPRIRYSPGAPPPVIATKRRPEAEEEQVASAVGRPTLPEERANPLLIAAAFVLAVGLLVFLVFLFGVRATR